MLVEYLLTPITLICLVGAAEMPSRRPGVKPNKNQPIAVLGLSSWSAICERGEASGLTYERVGCSQQISPEPH